MRRHTTAAAHKPCNKYQYNGTLEDSKKGVVDEVKLVAWCSFLLAKINIGKSD